VAEVFSSSPINLSRRRDLVGNNLTAWNRLLPRIPRIALSQDQDEFRWNLHQSGHFFVKPRYLALIQNDVPNLNKRLWKLKTPLKIKIFLWYLRRGIVLTKDNLAKRNWQGSKICCFCHRDETINHLFYECRFARAVWFIIHAAFGFSRPHSVSHMFGSWLWGIGKEKKATSSVRAAATCWSLWLCINSLVLDKNINYLLCRLSSKLFIGSVHGLFCSDQLHMAWLLRHLNT
jgi:hypothetical protein